LKRLRGRALRRAAGCMPSERTSTLQTNPPHNRTNLANLPGDASDTRPKKQRDKHSSRSDICHCDTRSRRGAIDLQVPRQPTASRRRYTTRERSTGSEVQKTNGEYPRFWGRKGTRGSQPLLRNNSTPPAPLPGQNLVGGGFPGSLHLQTVDKPIVRIGSKRGSEPVADDRGKGFEIRALT
jgi:hypothetical protein